MKATGIVRRIDELGRIVIPKEIRRTLRIRESDPLEIFTDREGEIILKKYSPLGELNQFATQFADSLAYASGCGIIITDRDHVIAGAGGKKEYINKRIAPELEEVIGERKSIKSEDRPISIVEDIKDNYNQVIVPIICEGDVIGAVAIIAKDIRDKLGEEEYKMALLSAGFLGKQMEN